MICKSNKNTSMMEFQSAISLGYTLPQIDQVVIFLTHLSLLCDSSKMANLAKIGKNHFVFVNVTNIKKFKKCFMSFSLF